jgi:unsaturated rhamnogalacturonyl hydrolase
VFALGPSERSAGVVARPLRQRANSAAYAVMGYWYYHWDWGEAIAFEGLDAWAAASGQPQFADFVTETLREWMAAPRAPSRFGPTTCLLTRHAEDPAYLAFARRVGDLLLAAPVTAGAVCLDSPSRSIFVDTLCSDPPFLLRLAALTDDPRYAMRAAEIALGHCRVLQDAESGLFGHFADLGSGVAPGIPWGRGNGWAALGLASYLAECGDVPERKEVADSFMRLCRGLAQHRIADAGWRNLIDRRESYPESSTTVLVAVAIEVGIRSGILDGAWQDLADCAWASVEHRLDASGHLVSVSYRPGINTDPSRYEHAPALGGAYPWAQGPYLLGAAQRIAAGDRATAIAG